MNAGPQAVISLYCAGFKGRRCGRWVQRGGFLLLESLSPVEFSFSVEQGLDCGRLIAPLAISSIGLLQHWSETLQVLLGIPFNSVPMQG
jgi:hypothetical protein